MHKNQHSISTFKDMATGFNSHKSKEVNKVISPISVGMLPLKAFCSSARDERKLYHSTKMETSSCEMQISTSNQSVTSDSLAKHDILRISDDKAVNIPTSVGMFPLKRFEAERE